MPAGFSTYVIDCSFDDPKELPFADVFAFSGINQDLQEMLAVRELLAARHPDAYFVVGGPIAWSLEQEGRFQLLDAFDYVFLLDGEQTFPHFLEAVASGTVGDLPRVIRAERFELSQARALDFGLYAQGAPVDRYYGASIEVSRGCPFLCEFCDIRVLPGNNRANNKPVALIIEEMERYRALGIGQFLFVCDNFIGDPSWASECAQAIIDWRERTGAAPSIFTWLTINLAKQPQLMKLLRRAGFSVLYIGVESVNQSSLQETAKLQNCGDQAGMLQRIHAHGFVIAPGLIFGFDSDTDAVFDETLAFIEQTGLIGGDPSFLSALPGTPLFDRLKRTGRLVEDPERVTERRKIATNVRYLQDHAFLARGFTDFMARFTSPGFQLARFRQHLKILLESEDFIDAGGPGFGSPWQYLRMQAGNAESRRMLLERISFLALQPRHLLAAMQAFVAWQHASKQRPGLGIHFYFWLYFWTNLGLKYQGLKVEDLQLHSVPAGMSLADIARDAAAAVLGSERLFKLRSKAHRQAAATSAALQRLAAAGAAAAHAR